jgi:hypothetical protein
MAVMVPCAKPVHVSLYSPEDPDSIAL